MKTTQKNSSKKIEIIKTKIITLTVKAQQTIAGGQSMVIELPKQGSYGCTL